LHGQRGYVPYGGGACRASSRSAKGCRRPWTTT
jgi:hypothetical protein